MDGPAGDLTRWDQTKLRFYDLRQHTLRQWPADFSSAGQGVTPRVTSWCQALSIANDGLVDGMLLDDRMDARNGLPGGGMGACRVVGDQLGEMLQQVGVTTDAVLSEQAIAIQLTHGSMNPAPVASITTVAAPSMTSATVTR